MKLSRIWSCSDSIILLLLVYILRLPVYIHGISLSCYKPASNLDNNYVEIIVDCSRHGFGMREDLIFHQSKICSNSQDLCDLITGFDYSNNAIKHLGKSKYEFKLINKLLFKSNYINFIEEDAFNGGKLKVVDLSFNKLTGSSLRRNIFRGKYNESKHDYEGSSIEKLLLGNNEIQYLRSESFHYLKKLNTLELNNNPLSVIGESTKGELQSLRQLYSLHLGSTNLSYISDDTFTNMRLDTLYLNGNKLIEVPNLKSLQNTLLNLNLNNNYFTQFNDHSFSNLHYLTCLNISANSNLKIIKKNTFQYLINLQILYCNYNHKLNEIHPYAFDRNWNLREFYLNNNGLTFLPHELGDWDTLEVLDIQSNPWTCDCSIQWMIDYVAKRQRSDPELNYNLYCADPIQFRSVHILSNKLLSYISSDCVKGVLGISNLSDHFYKLYPLLFIMSVLLFTMILYVLCSMYKYAKTHVPHVCNYTVQYNKLSTSVQM